MEGIKFKESNVCLGKPKNMTDEECGSLHVYTDGTICVSCWKMTWKDRLKALLFGRVWLGVLSGHTQPPVWLQCRKTVFVEGDKE